MSPAKKKATSKKAAKKKPAKKSAAKKKPTKKAAAKKKKTAKKPAAKKKSAKKAEVKKAKGKAGRKKAADAAPPAKPTPPPRPGPLVVARGKKISKLGIRWTCWGCGSAFYDLNKPDPVCPKCGQNQKVKPDVEKPSEPPPKRDSMRALRVLDDEDAPATDDDAAVDMDIELGTNEKLLDEAEEAADSDDD